MADGRYFEKSNLYYYLIAVRCPSRLSQLQLQCYDYCPTPACQLMAEQQPASSTGDLAYHRGMWSPPVGCSCETQSYLQQQPIRNPEMT